MLTVDKPSVWWVRVVGLRLKGVLVAQVYGYCALKLTAELTIGFKLHGVTEKLTSLLSL